MSPDKRLFAGTTQSVVQASWQRCIDIYGMDPSRIPCAELLSAKELRDKIEPYALLMRSAQREVEDLFRKLVDNDYIVSMAAPDGLKLSIRCDHHFLGEMSGFGVLPGSVWNEREQGTNGIGTALSIGQAVSINGTDHFSAHNKDMSCHAAPIFGKNGMIEAVVNVTSVRQEQDLAARLVLNMLRTAAARIESRHFLERNRNARLFTLGRDRDFQSFEEELQIAIDENGRIADVTSNHALYLGTTDLELIGQALEDVVDLPRWWEEGQKISQICLPDGQSMGYLRALPNPVSPTVKSAYAPTTRDSEPPGNDALSLAMNTIASQPSSLPLRPFVNSEQMIRLRKAVQVYKAGLPIFLTGETGTGKSSSAFEMARQIGARVFQVFCNDPVQLTAVAKLIDLHDGHTPIAIILEGVQDLDPHHQGKLMALLANDPLVARKRLHVIATSIEPLPDLSKASSGRATLRPDLLSRLSGLVVDCAPLRSFPNLQGQIQDVFDYVFGATVQFSREVAAVLQNHHWPGNLRELERVAKMSFVFYGENDHSDTTIELDSLPDNLLNSIQRENLTARSQSEAARIEAALKYHNGNLSETARYLGVSRSTLYRKVQISKMR